MLNVTQKSLLQLVAYQKGCKISVVRTFYKSTRFSGFLINFVRARPLRGTKVLHVRARALTNQRFVRVSRLTNELLHRRARGARTWLPHAQIFGEAKNL